MRERKLLLGAILIVLFLVIGVSLSYADPLPTDVVQDLTFGHYLTTSGTYGNIGDVIPLEHWDTITFITDLTINGATDTTFRLLGKRSAADTQLYSYPLKSATSTQVNVSPHIWVLTDDANQSIVFDEDDLGNMPYVQLQGKCTYTGTAAAMDIRYTRDQK